MLVPTRFRVPMSFLCAFMGTWAVSILLQDIDVQHQVRTIEQNNRRDNSEQKERTQKHGNGSDVRSTCFKSNIPLAHDRLPDLPATAINGGSLKSAINNFFTVGENEKKDKYINLHQYSYSLNTQICVNRKLFLLMLVYSAPKNIEQRKNIRSTYGSVKLHKGRELGVVFLLGAVDDQKLQESLSDESKTFGDIVQGDFHDSYRNLSRKLIMGMHWFHHSCCSEFILKVDDDIFVNPFRMVEYLANESATKNVLRCHILLDEKPIRNPESKWYTPVKQYPFPLFPPFCVGFAYITTQRAWEALYRASEDRRIIEMEDVFNSVVLSLRANVGKVYLKNVYECNERGSRVTIEDLNKSILVLDRHNLCGDRPFKQWELLNKE